MSNISGLPGSGQHEQAIGICPECGAANALMYGNIREFSTPDGRREWERPWRCGHCEAYGAEYLVVELNYQFVHGRQDLFKRCDA